MVVAEVVPTDLLRAVFEEHVADPAARINDLQIEPLVTNGFSGNQVYRASVSWTGAPVAGQRCATWVFKRWLPGGHGQRLLGVDRPLEVLAWERGILRPSAQPPGVVIPTIGARLDRSGDAAWIMMEDVSSALGAYSREAPLQPSEAVARLKQVLDRLARLHAWWERPERRAVLRRHAGLVPFERYIWCEAASYALALGRTPPAGTAPGRPVTDELRADLHAFLDWLPAGDRPGFERLLHRREALVAALRAFPRTLLHGDADDRNIGLRQPAASTALRQGDDSVPNLVLIDWEWIGMGPPALDVARVCGSAAAVCDPSQPRPEALFSGELPEHYFERYRSYGGLLTDRDAWHRSFAAAFLAAGLTQVAFAGSMIRHGVRPVVATFERQMEMVLPTVRRLGGT